VRRATFAQLKLFGHAGEDPSIEECARESSGILFGGLFMAHVSVKTTVKIGACQGKLLARIKASNWIRELRARLGVTQDEFAHALGVAESTVRNWESGRNPPHRGAAARIRGLEQAKIAEKTGRYSQETREQLIAALDTILDRAPSTVVQQTSEFLTSKAGKYGEPKD
jgi:DNA-binding transcriptional regulator YiaG